MNQGRKDDLGKIRYGLVPPGALRAVAQVLTFGAAKYGPENWRQVPDARTRYTDAAMRHLEAFRAGEWEDPETGLPHLAHLGCCVLFLLELGQETPKASPTIPSAMGPDGPGDLFLDVLEKDP